MTPAAQKLTALVTAFAADDEKFTFGNSSAGARARAALQEIKKLAQERRLEIQAQKNAAKETKAA